MAKSFPLRKKKRPDTKDAVKKPRADLIIPSHLPLTSEEEKPEEERAILLPTFLKRWKDELPDFMEDKTKNHP